MSHTVDRMLRRQGQERRRIGIAAIAGFLLRQYQSADPRCVSPAMNEQVNRLWEFAEMHPDEDALLKNDDVKALRRDLERGLEGIGEAAATMVLSASEAIRSASAEDLAEVWDRFDEGLEHVAEPLDQDEWYSRNLEALKGLPVNEIKIRVYELNERMSRGKANSKFGRDFKAFERLLLQTLSRQDAFDPGLIARARGIAASSFLQ